MGFGGYGGNMQQIMKQAQMMQKKLQEAQAQLAEAEVTGTAGGGMVEVVIKANKTPVSVSIKPEAVDPDDVEMLEDLVLAALNDAMEKRTACRRNLWDLSEEAAFSDKKRVPMDKPRMRCVRQCNRDCNNVRIARVGALKNRTV